MQAQRKFDDVASVSVPETPHPRAIEADLADWDDAIAASPARRLHQELVAHFERPEIASGSTTAVATVDGDKWSMPIRLTMIFGGSALLWVGIGGIVTLAL